MLQRGGGFVVGLGGGDLLGHVRLERLGIDAAADGGHDENREEESEADDDLIGRGVLDAECGADKAEDDDDAGEARH